VSSSQRVLPAPHFSLGHGAKPASKQKVSVHLSALPADGLINRDFPLSGTQHGGGLILASAAAATAHHEGDGSCAPGAHGDRGNGNCRCRDRKGRDGDSFECERRNSCDGFLSWPHKLAVRVQMALMRTGSNLAEPIGRCLDGALASSANGHSFKPWASPPLPGLTSPAPSLSSSDAPIKTSAVPTTRSNGRPSPPASRPLTPPKPPPQAHVSSSKSSTPISKMSAPARLASMACLVMTCAVQLDFSMLGLTVPAVHISEIPTSETAESISYATASLLHLQPHEIGLLRADNTAVSPRVPLSSLVVDGEVHLKVIPHQRVGAVTSS
jgi:hypothetical protein